MYFIFNFYILREAFKSMRTPYWFFFITSKAFGLLPNLPTLKPISYLIGPRLTTVGWSTLPEGDLHPLYDTSLLGRTVRHDSERSATTGACFL